MMSVIAVAGGTGGLGRAIVDALIKQGGAQVFVLGRKATPEKEQQIGAKILAVDYDNVQSLTHILQGHQIGTVISTMSPDGPGPELALIKAAEESNTTKRFIPSQWGMELNERIAEYWPAARDRMLILETLKKSPLQWTYVSNGFFADYAVAPHVKTYLQHMAMIIDADKDAAAIPGTGNVHAVFTHTIDLAKYVAKLTTLPKWGNQYSVVGDRLTLNELVEIAQQAKGTKFSVAYDSLDKLKQGKVTELPSHPYLYPYFPKEQLQGMLAAFGRMFEEGDVDIHYDQADLLNNLFPDIKPRSIKQLFAEAYKA